MARTLRSRVAPLLTIAVTADEIGCGGTVHGAQPATITLRMQSSWPAPDIFHEIFLDRGKKVEEMSGGRLKIEIFPTDAVDQGTLDGGHSIPV
jgi:TRAP-type mannitol/chloroaromatic compound transport system substrate-binding protein